MDVKEIRERLKTVSYGKTCKFQDVMEFTCKCWEDIDFLLSEVDRLEQKYLVEAMIARKSMAKMLESGASIARLYKEKDQLIRERDAAVKACKEWEKHAGFLYIHGQLQPVTPAEDEGDAT